MLLEGCSPCTKWRLSALHPVTRVAKPCEAWQSCNGPWPPSVIIPSSLGVWKTHAKTAQVHIWGPTHKDEGKHVYRRDNQEPTTKQPDELLQRERRCRIDRKLRFILDLYGDRSIGGSRASRASYSTRLSWSWACRRGRHGCRREVCCSLSQDDKHLACSFCALHLWVLPAPHYTAG